MRNPYDVRMPSTTRSRGRPGVSRESLITALAAVFRQHGYDGASLAELASATGLGKASLYHHFPGGKADMAGVLIRHQIAEAHGLAFCHLTSGESAELRLARFLDGFERYTDDGERCCLLTILGQGNPDLPFQALIKTQFDDWTAALSAAFEAQGQGSKRSRRRALAVMTELYGGLSLGRIQASPKPVRAALKRLRKTLL